MSESLAGGGGGTAFLLANEKFVGQNSTSTFFSYFSLCFSNDILFIYCGTEMKKKIFFHTKMVCQIIIIHDIWCKLQRKF